MMGLDVESWQTIMPLCLHAFVVAQVARGLVWDISMGTLELWSRCLKNACMCVVDSDPRLHVYLCCLAIFAGMCVA